MMTMIIQRYCSSNRDADVLRIMYAAYDEMKQVYKILSRKAAVEV